MRELQGEGVQEQHTPSSQQASSGSSASGLSDEENTLPVRQPGGLARPEPISPGSASGESSDSFGEEAAVRDTTTGLAEARPGNVPSAAGLLTRLSEGTAVLSHSGPAGRLCEEKGMPSGGAGGSWS